MKRTLIMLGALLTGMALVAGVLLLLDPGPVHQPPACIILPHDIQGDRSPESILFDTAPACHWDSILIRSSADARGHHFVVRQGEHGAKDRIEVEECWRRQRPAAPYATQDPRAAKTIVVAVTGGTQSGELQWLLSRLAARYQIPAPRVWVQGGAIGGLPLAQQ